MAGDDWDNYESGPFCRHWGDPDDCSERCASCGHGCTRHAFESPGECNEDGCECGAWAERPEDTP